MSGRLSRMATETPTAGPTNRTPGPATGAAGGAGVELIESLTRRELEDVGCWRRRRTRRSRVCCMARKRSCCHVNILHKLAAAVERQRGRALVGHPAPPRARWNGQSAVGAVFSGPAAASSSRRRSKRQPPRRAKRWPSNQERTSNNRRADRTAPANRRPERTPSPAQREHEAALERLRHRFDTRSDALTRAQAAVAELREITLPSAMLGLAPGGPVRSLDARAGDPVGGSRRPHRR